jgi:hypothetical protein
MLQAYMTIIRVQVEMRLDWLLPWKRACRAAHWCAQWRVPGSLERRAMPCSTGRTPLESAGSELGARAVEDVVMRALYGFPV